MTTRRERIWTIRFRCNRTRFITSVSRGDGSSGDYKLTITQE